MTDCPFITTPHLGPGPGSTISTSLWPDSTGLNLTTTRLDTMEYAPSPNSVRPQAIGTPGTSTPSYSGSSTPLSGSFSSAAPTTPGGSFFGLHGHGHGHGHNHQAHAHGYGNHHTPLPVLDIQLDNDEILLRGAGSDYNPALLSGRVVLNLQESTNIREISMRLEGKGKVVFYDAGA